MAKNLTGKQAGIVKGDSVNDPQVRVMRGKNMFPQSFRHPTTNRYGEVDVVGAMRAERGDTFPYKFVTDLNTYTLQSPIKSEVNMYTAAFKVPLKAIYPRNWDIMYPIPNKGSDVPVDTRAVFDVGLFYNVIHSSLFTLYSSGNFDVFVRLILLLESVFSAGSLFAKFNMHLNSFRFDDLSIGEKSISFDRWFDVSFAPNLENFLVYNGQGNINASLSPLDNSSGLPFVTVVPEGDSRLGANTTANTYVTFRRALELLRQGSYGITLYNRELIISDFFDGIPDIVDKNGVLPTLMINIEPIIAYQLICAHFFSNPKVDYVYTSELFLDNAQSLAYGDSAFIPTYMWNGIIKLYDVFSGYYLRVMAQRVENIDREGNWDDPATYLPVLMYWHNLFTIQRSLRYGDYFTSAHVEPLAPGDINAPVIDGSVNALDITRTLQWTRLLNKVHISGPRVDDYLLALFGGFLPEAPDDVPIRLSLEKSKIEGFEVNNTGAEQASVDSRNITTTNLRLTDSRYMFEASIDKPCWLIVVQYYDAQRIYSKTLDRFAYHHDRFDDFIPDLQFEGDQDVKLQELDITRPDVPFAYNLRYMEYKNRYSYASGGFIENLPSWAFITDNADGSEPNDHINPDYIRSSPTEFDRFYKSFAGAYSLGSYFHFILYNTNVVNPQRQMVLAPEILA